MVEENVVTGWETKCSEKCVESWTKVGWKDKRLVGKTKKSWLEDESWLVGVFGDGVVQGVRVEKEAFFLRLTTAFSDKP